MEHSHENITPFGDFNGQTVHCITLKNSRGSQIKVLTYGAIWHSFEILDKNKQPFDVVVAPKTLEDYLIQSRQKPYFFGATIGRYAGRINKGALKVGDKEYQLDQEDDVHLHGGAKGIHSKVWKMESWSMGDSSHVTLSCTSQHLEDGYPGNLKVMVTYTLTQDDQVIIEYRAESDDDTIINLTNHVYLNLGRESVLKQKFYVDADFVLETDEKLVPTGKYRNVEGSPYDFKKSQLLEKIEAINGLDTCFVFNKEKEEPNISLHSTETGIHMQVNTNQPAVVVFAPEQVHFVGNPKNELRSKEVYPTICLETQGFPDAPNHGHFPSTFLKRGDIYTNTTQYKFSVKA